MMNDTEQMMHDCFPLWAKGYEIGEREGRERMAQNIINLIHKDGCMGKCEITVDDILAINARLSNHNQ